MNAVEAPSISLQGLVNPAIYYHTDGFNTDQTKLMGRQVAGESFLKAFCEYSSFSELSCFTFDPKMAQEFNQKVLSFSGKTKKTKSLYPHSFSGLEELGCMFVPGPNLEDLAWQRRHYNQRAYSLCGITHTISSDRAMRQIASLFLAPVQTWDALICTSKSVKTVLETLLGDYREYLSMRTGSLSVSNPVQMPVIPLGVDYESLKPTSQKMNLGKELRRKHGLSEDTVVFLFMGRLSFHAKAHPYQMFIALEEAAKRTKHKIALILAGWFANKDIENSFKEAATITCPSVPIYFVDGRNPEVRNTIWYAADIFTSLSDNIQETFGITPIEAKAAGLPVVVSDWDGYKDTINHDQDGFLIPTIMPKPGSGIDLAFEYSSGKYNYDHYIGRVSQTTSIDLNACVEAYTRLIESPELRRKMGRHAQEDVNNRFNWPVIIESYQQLWANLEELRTRNEETSPNNFDSPPNPLASDPYRLFKSYPTKEITLETQLSISGFELNSLTNQLSSNQFAKDMLCTESQINSILESVLLKQPITVVELAEIHKNFHISKLFKTIGWLLKMGVICTYN